MNPKQDRPGARTPADLERKYNFGENFYEIKETIERQNIAMEKQSQLFTNYVGTNDKALQALVENYGKLLEKLSQLEGNIAKIDNRVTDVDNKFTDVDNKIGSAVDSLCKAEAGFIKIFGGGEVPDGFLPCNGSSYSRTKYPELFAAIGTTFGAGDGSTTFNVPNLATRVPVGIGTGYALGATGGEAAHTLILNEIPSHQHLELMINNNYLTIWSSSNRGGNALHMDSLYQANGANNNTFGTGYAGGGAAHNNMQPYTVVNYIIATGKTFVNTST